jgi:hypothetical protein
MNDLGRWLISFGLMLILVGCGMFAVGRFPWLGHLPGDIVIKREHLMLGIARTDRPDSQAVISIITLLTSPTLPAIFSAVSISLRRYRCVMIGTRLALPLVMNSMT